MPGYSMATGGQAQARDGEVVFKATDQAPAPETCPACDEQVIPGQRFCEACGEDMNPGADGLRCVDCSAPSREIDPDGYCMQCGRKQPDRRDHLEIDEGHVVGVTDRGTHHHRNEDAFALSALPHGGVMVVCDGVSTTGEPQRASQAAADAAVASLVGDIRNGHPDLSEAMVEAVAEAQTAVLGSGGVLTGDHPASCTIVAAVATRDPTTKAVQITVGWLGDSRGYWIDREANGSFAATQLTEDDSWATAQVASGAMTEEEALREPQAHSITRWLGADAVDVVPRVVTRTGSAGGMVLLCSDGLWNYLPEAEGLAAKLADVAAPGAHALATELTRFAIDSGGHDNITVTIIQI